jgi:hypothetical protein
MPSDLDAAIRALDAGDLDALTSMLDADPALVHARVETDEAPYDGYFHRATLLHHVAGNPIRRPLPANIAAIARLLIDRGAEVEATCGGGPSQPGTGGDTTMALVASGCQAAKQGFSESLIDVLAGAGADINHLWTALYHTVEYRGQRDVAMMLYKRRATVDLAFAAALGKQRLVDSFFRGHGGLQANAYRAEARPDFARLEQPTTQQILDEALVLASMNGSDSTIPMLLDRGADIHALVPMGGVQITPLHGAAWAGWPRTAKLLLDRGADVNRRDPVHNSAPPGWASICQRQSVLDVFRECEPTYDLPNAVEFGCVERARELLGNGDPDQALGHGERGVLLRLAAWEGHLNIVRLLLEHGADPALASADGRTALFYAEEQGRDEVAALIRSHQTSVRA